MYIYIYKQKRILGEQFHLSLLSIADALWIVDSLSNIHFAAIPNTSIGYMLGSTYHLNLEGDIKLMHFFNSIITFPEKL